jgi:serine/threonine-protein kinase
MRDSRTVGRLEEAQRRHSSFPRALGEKAAFISKTMLAPGMHLGAYEVLGHLGAGGMGEVYRAKDTKLGRDVALKILPASFTTDPERIARFRREAQVLASLNHPHIAQIHGLEEVEGTQFLVLELVDGESLDKRIARGPIPIDEALAIAKQIAEALEAAHEKGIIHRDLKPANIALTNEGSVKVLDFGLAKATQPPGGAAVDAMNSPTITSPAMMTGVGVILGTAAYMSPEQAKGRAADKRSDIWAFGCVLYEMLTGKRAFEGEDVSDTLAAVLRGQPDWHALSPRVPANVRTILSRCLDKQRQSRFGDVSTVIFLLNESAERADESPQRAKRPTRVVAVAFVAGLAVMAGIAWAWLRPIPVKLPLTRFSIVPPAAQPFNVQGFFRNLAISPDGTRIVYSVATGGGSQLMVRSIDQLDPVPLRGIDSAAFPFFSPNGQWIGFFTTGANGELKKVAVTGGAPITLCQFRGTARGATWGPDDTIVFATADRTTGLMAVPAGGGEPKVLTRPDAAHGEQDHLFPEWLPGGQAVLFTITDRTALDNHVAVFDVKTGRTKTLIRGGGDAQYADTGHLVYAAASTLRAVAFDPTRLEVRGDPVPVVEDVMMLSTGAADFRIARQGTLVYVRGNGLMGALRSLVWVNRDGRQAPINAAPGNYVAVRLSPDGTRLAVTLGTPVMDIWMWDFGRQSLQKLTFGGFGYPVWTPDGHRIAFRNLAGDLFWQAADGTGTPQRLLADSSNQHTPLSFSPGGHELIVSEINPKTAHGDLMRLRLDGSGAKLEPLLSKPFNENGGQLSPDGRWIAYYSDESGRAEVYVRPYPKIDAGRWLISTDGGSRPLWSRNGRELFYINLNTGIMAVDVRTSPGFSADKPIKFFDGPVLIEQNFSTYDASPDGTQFVVIKTDATGDRNTLPTITVVLNWLDDLKQRVPTK